MSMLDETMQDSIHAKEPQCQPDGEYKLLCVGTKRGSNEEKGSEWINILNSPTEPVNSPAALVTDMLMAIKETDDTDTKERKKLKMKQCAEALGVAPTELLNQDLVKGKKFWAKVKFNDDPDYGPQNRIQRYMRPSETD